MLLVEFSCSVFGSFFLNATICILEVHLCTYIVEIGHLNITSYAFQYTMSSHQSRISRLLDPSSMGVSKLDSSEA